MDAERILIVDDDEGLLRLLGMRLTAMGFAVRTCASGAAALEEARRLVFDLAILDIRLADMDGLALLEELLLVHPGLPAIILTAHGSIPNAVEAMQKGAYGYLTKPFDDKELEAHIEKALAQLRMSRELQRLKRLVKEIYGLEQVVARSQAMQTLLQQAAQVADTDVTILLLGETGSGKEVTARIIHCNSRRAHGPFIAVNCAAIPEPLFESEIFGHVKGAFTGAVESRRGLFHQAEGGTLFLDEIGDLPLQLQAKLLRVLQDREVQEVGAEKPRRVDVRIIAATNRNLEQAVRDGAFREDLYYRIQVVPLRVPPLRERRDDIPALAQLALEQSSRRLGKEVRGFTPEALQKLMLHAWPGNVRELENTVEKAVIMATQSLIPADLITFSGPQAESPVKPLTTAREDFEREYLQRLMELTGGNITRASQLAGRYRADFYKLLKKYGLYAPSRRGPRPDRERSGAGPA